MAQYNVYTISLLLAALIAVCGGVWILIRRFTPASHIGAVAVFASAEWMAAYAFACSDSGIRA